jgi:hypothetical protein
VENATPKLFVVMAGDTYVFSVLARTADEARALVLEKIPTGLPDDLLKVHEVDGPVGAVEVRPPTGQGPFPLSRSLYEAFPSLAVCLPSWEAAMGTCFHFEVSVRLLAQKHFGGRSITEDVGDRENGKKPGLLSMLFDKLSFSDEEKVFLPRCNRLRNKIIHCEQDALQACVRELKPDFVPRPTVTRMNSPKGASAEEMLSVIQDRTNAVPVQGTSTRADGFFGWMLEAAYDGTFETAANLLGSGVRIINSKATQ